MRERVAFLVLVTVLILLFAFTFAVLGKGDYEPTRHEGGVAPAQASLSALG